jgi:hypothetical protein
MTRKAAYAVLIAALILAVCGCAGDDPDKLASEALAKRDQALCEKIADYRMRYNCSIGVAVAEDNESMCAKIGEQNWVEDCYSKIAANRRDLKVCDNIAREMRKDACYKGVAASN